MKLNINVGRRGRSLFDAFHRFLTRGGRPGSLRQRHESLVNSRSRVSPEERIAFHDSAAALPFDPEAVAEGDAVVAEYLKGAPADDVRRDSKSAGSPAA